MPDLHGVASPAARVETPPEPGSARRAPVALAWTLAAVAAGMAGLTVVAAAAHGAITQVYAPSMLLGVATALVGGLIASRRPTHLMGWLLLLIGGTQALVEFAGTYSNLAYRYGEHLPAPELFAWLNTWMWMPGLGSTLTFLFLLFPDGHLPSPRWRWVAWVSGSTLTFAIGAVAISAWPARGPALLSSSGPPPGSLAAVVVGPVMLVMTTCALASVLSLFIRYRRSTADVRHQLKWFMYAAAFMLAVVAIDFMPLHGFAVTAGVIAQSLGVIALPSAIAVAILRYRLYDIDLVISRTLVYGSLAAFITAVYVGIVVGIGTLIGSGSQPNLVLSIAATAVVAVAFQPVRARLQRVANRLVYGTRATPYEVLSEFSHRVAESYAANDVLPRMARVLAEGTGAAHADVWIRSGSVLRQAASWPARPEVASAPTTTADALLSLAGTDRAAEVRRQGELLGVLTVSKRPGESLTPVEENLLADLAKQAGLVLENVGLNAQLLQHLEDLRASRKRLVAAQDEERRRLERNLHDGAQQHLVALKVKLGLAEMLARTNPDKARLLVHELASDADEALDTLRDLARGIYPPLLADRGLVAALEAQARRATIPVEVQAHDVGRYSQDVEAALYFCCLEALQNVQKYAGASHASVRLSADHDTLRMAVADDGVGFDTAVQARGSGLQNMEDRLAALGGTLEIESEPGTGTVVTATAPQVARAAMADPVADRGPHAPSAVGARSPGAAAPTDRATG